MVSKGQNIEILYEFFLDGKQIKSFKIQIDKDSLNLVSDKKRQSEDWTRLDFHKCPTCPLSADDYQDCPVAMNLSEAGEIFSDSVSHETVLARVTQEGKTIEKELPLQKALASLFGIYMVASPCPLLASMKPLLRFHFPFASAEETLFRVLSSFLLGQYFKVQEGENLEWTLKPLIKIYDTIHDLNKSIRKRLSAISNKDANMNAVVSLDNFAVNTEFRLSAGILEEFEKLYALGSP